MLDLFVFRNPPNSGRDYGIFNVRTYVIILISAYPPGGSAHRQRVSTTCLTRTTYIFLVLLTLTGFEPRVFGSGVRRSTNRATPSPSITAIGVVVTLSLEVTTKCNKDRDIGFPPGTTTSPPHTTPHHSQLHSSLIEFR